MLARVAPARPPSLPLSRPLPEAEADGGREEGGGGRPVRAGRQRGGEDAVMADLALEGQIGHHGPSTHSLHCAQFHTQQCLLPFASSPSSSSSSSTSPPPSLPTTTKPRRLLRLRPPRRHALRAPRPPPAGRLHRALRPRLLQERQPLRRRHQLPHRPLPLLAPPLAAALAVRAHARLRRAPPPLRLLVRLQVRQLLPDHLGRHGVPQRLHHRQQQLHLHAGRAEAVRRRHVPLDAAADGARRVLAATRGVQGRRGRARRAQGAPRGRDGVRRRVRLQDGARGGGGGAGQRGRPVRGAREGGRVQGDGERAVGEDQPGAGRRRHGQDGHHRRPQRRHARRLHLQHGHRRRARGRLHGARPDDREHGGAGRAPGGGVPVDGRPDGAGHGGAGGAPGHAVRARHAAVLHPVPRGRHGGLHLRQLGGRAPRQRRRGAAAAAAAGEGRDGRAHGAGPHRPGAAHGDRAPGLPRQRQRRVHGILPAEARRAPRLPRPAVEGVLAHRVRRLHARRDRAAGRVDAMERRLRARDALLRRVRQRGPRRRPKPGGVEQPGAQGARRRVQRRQLHTGGRVDTQSVVAFFLLF
uniref:Predicted protein n=1 Tax=Hordeum vulgare subsp. vulgare TaxID=112509 RepID=F2DQI0_HORVV|nr:predicted protein [Hordeum vulgare subsp. vulgare]